MKLIHNTDSRGRNKIVMFANKKFPTILTWRMRSNLNCNNKNRINSPIILPGIGKLQPIRNDFTN